MKLKQKVETMMEIFDLAIQFPCKVNLFKVSFPDPTVNHHCGLVGRFWVLLTLDRVSSEREYWVESIEETMQFLKKTQKRAFRKYLLEEMGMYNSRPQKGIHYIISEAGAT